MREARGPGRPADTQNRLGAFRGPEGRKGGRRAPRNKQKALEKCVIRSTEASETYYTDVQRPTARSIRSFSFPILKRIPEDF